MIKKLVGTMKTHPVLLLCIIALVAVISACSQGAGESTSPSTSSSEDLSTPIAAPDDEINEELEDQAGAAETLSNSFPLPDGTTIDADSINEDDPDRGSFELDTTADLGGLVDFYQTALTDLGWTYRYTDANTLGGVTQYWKYIEKYVTVQYGYDQTRELVRIEYDRVGPDAFVHLPKDFPLPENVEFTRAGDTSWDLYIEQDFSAVNSLYTQASSGWSKCSGFSGSVDASGDDGGQKFPPGVTPMPAPTRDARPWKKYCWVLPDKNQVELTIAPHGNATLLIVIVTSLNASDSGLPAGIEVYPGATIQSATPGMVTFQAGASLETIKAFYEESLKAAGWTPNGTPFASGGTVLMNWQKDNQSIMITISDMGGNSCLAVIVVE